MKYLSALLASIVLLSCNNNSVKKDEPKPTNQATITCFLSALNNDTVSLQLKDSNNILTGTLNYLPYEKDGTIGNLYDLKFSGDTLFGMYKSEQEGQETVGEMAMLKRGKMYILTNDIWGSDNYKYDSAYTNGKFVAKNKITFTGDTLKETNCK